MNVDVGDVGVMIGEDRRQVRQHAGPIDERADDGVCGHSVNLQYWLRFAFCILKCGTHIIAGTMNRYLVIIAALIAAMAMPALALAQTPPATAQAPPPMYGTPITADQAKPIAAAAIAAAKKNQWMMAVAIVDPWGELVYFERMDNT